MEEFDVAVEARGRGLLRGIELSIPARSIAEKALAQGVMLNCVQGNVVRFLPPLILERQHVTVALDMLHRLLAEHAGEWRVSAESLIAVPV